MLRRFRVPLLLVSIALLGVSCVRFVGPEDIRHDLSDQAGVKLKQETGFTFTRSAVWLARHFVKEEDFTLEGWESIVRVHEPGEDVMVLFKAKDDVVRSLLIVVAEPDEWVLVRIRGKLDKVLEQAIEMAFEDVGRSDLYAKTRRERGLDPPVEQRAALVSLP